MSHTPSSDLAVSLRCVTKCFGSQTAVNAVDLEIPQGSIHGIIGPNGSGKTTTLRMILRIYRPDSGTVTVLGKDLGEAADDRVGYLPEERGLYHRMKVRDVLRYFAMLKGHHRPDRDIDRWLEQLQATEWSHKRIEQLSKGMAQKIQFIAAVVANPRLVILDEPFSGLDPVNSNLIKDEIHRLAQNGSTILFSTHRMEQVEEICEHIILVNKGEKILDGTVGAVKEQYKQNHFRLGIPALPDDLLSQAPFELIRKGEREQIVQIHEDKTTNDVLQFLLDRSIPIRSFEELLPSLNEIFIRLVGDSPTARQFQIAS